MTTITKAQRKELASAYEAVQQACAIFAGPYADGERRIMRIAYEPETITAEDIVWAEEFVGEMASNVDFLAYELRVAIDQLDSVSEHYEDDEEDA